MFTPKRFTHLTLLLILSLTLFITACSVPAAENPTPIPNQPTGGLNPITEPEPNTTEEPLANAPETDEPTADNLAPLPLISQKATTQGLGGGLESADAPLAAQSSTFVDAINIFSGTTFLLDTALPTDPTAAAVWQQPARTLTAEYAQQTAQNFGFPTTVYQEQYSLEPLPNEGSRELYNPTPPYFAFQDNKLLIITAGSIFYSDNTYATQYGDEAPFDQLAPAAEAFLSEKGWLNFDYQLSQNFPGEINVTRLVDGQPIDRPEIYVRLNDQSQVMYASWDMLNELENIGTYPLITAEAAWQQLQTPADTFDIPFIFEPTNESIISEEIPINPNYRNWQRTYQPGDEAILYTYPNIYITADASTPVVIVNQYRLIAPEAELQSLAAQADQTLRLQGNITDDGRGFALTSWEIFENTNPIFAEGTVQIQADGTAVITDDLTGNNYIIPTPPADLENNTAIYIFGRATRDTGLAHPVIDWENIETRLNPTEIALEEQPPTDEFIEPFPIDGGFTTYETINITNITLRYYYTAPWDNERQAAEGWDTPPVIIQPVWQFSGSTTATETGETENVTFYVQATAPELID